MNSSRNTVVNIKAEQEQSKAAVSSDSRVYRWFKSTRVYKYFNHSPNSAQFKRTFEVSATLFSGFKPALSVILPARVSAGWIAFGAASLIGLIAGKEKFISKERELRTAALNKELLNNLKEEFKLHRAEIKKLIHEMTALKLKLVPKQWKLKNIAMRGKHALMKSFAVASSPVHFDADGKEANCAAGKPIKFSNVPSGILKTTVISDTKNQPEQVAPQSDSALPGQATPRKKKQLRIVDQNDEIKNSNSDVKLSDEQERKLANEFGLTAEQQEKLHELEDFLSAEKQKYANIIDSLDEGEELTEDFLINLPEYQFTSKDNCERVTAGVIAWALTTWSIFVAISQSLANEVEDSTAPQITGAVFGLLGGIIDGLNTGYYNEGQKIKALHLEEEMIKQFRKQLELDKLKRAELEEKFNQAKECLSGADQQLEQTQDHIRKVSGFSFKSEAKESHSSSAAVLTSLSVTQTSVEPTIAEPTAQTMPKTKGRRLPKLSHVPATSFSTPAAKYSQPLPPTSTDATTADIDISANKAGVGLVMSS